MTSVNYPSPVTVNGYSCKNCTDVDYARKNIDPAHPSDGPYGVNAKDRPGGAHGKASEAPAVTFGGVLAGISPTANANVPAGAAQGQRLDLSA